MAVLVPHNYFYVAIKRLPRGPFPRRLCRYDRSPSVWHSPTMELGATLSSCTSLALACVVGLTCDQGPSDTADENQDSASLDTLSSSDNSDAETEGGDQDEAEEESPCDTVSTTAIDSLDETTPLGFTPREVLLLAEGNHDTNILWHTLEGIGIEPESGSVPFEIDVLYAGEGLYFRELKPSSSNAGEVCEDHIAISVDVSLRTAEGALNEEQGGDLRAASLDKAELYLFLQPSDLTGSLDVTDADDNHDISGFLHVNGTFPQTGAPSGTLSVEVQTEGEDGTESNDVAFAHWPA